MGQGEGWRKVSFPEDQKDSLQRRLIGDSRKNSGVTCRVTKIEFRRRKYLGEKRGLCWDFKNTFLE